MSRVVRIVFLLGVVWLGAAVGWGQKLTITSLVNEGPVYLGDSVSLGADFEFENIPFNADGAFFFREIYDGGEVIETRRSLSRQLPTPRISVFRVRQLLTCEPDDCGEEFPTVQSNYKKLLRLEMFGVMFDDADNVIARSETRTIDVIPPPQILSISAVGQPLQTRQRVRVTTSGFRFTQTGGLRRGINIFLAHRADQSRVLRYGFNPDNITESQQCEHSSQTRTFSGCSPQIISDNVIEFVVSLYARDESVGVKDFEHIGPHDLIIVSQEPRDDQPQRTDARARYAVAFDAYDFDAPSQNDVILWKGLTVRDISDSSSEKQFDPNIVNYFPTAGGAIAIGVTATMDYQLARMLDARLWLRLRKRSNGAFLNDRSVSMTLLSRRVNNSEGELVEFAYSKNFDLPAGDDYVDFTLLFAVGGLSDPEPMNIFYESRPVTVFFGAAAPPEAEIDVKPQYIEVTQAIQDDNNNIRLVAGKPTLARVFIGVGEPQPMAETKVEAILHGFPAGSDTPLPGSPIQPMLVFGRAPARDGNYDRAKATESVNFELPDAWVQEGFITLVAEVDPMGKLENETTVNNYGGQETFRFFQRDQLFIGYMKLCVQTPGRDERCPTDFVSNSEGFIRKAYPINPLDVFYFPLPVPQSTLVADLDDEEERQKLLKRLRKSYDLADFLSAGKIDQIAVWVHPFVPIGDQVGGFSDPLWYRKEGTGRITIMREPTSTLPRETLLAHEVGHNLGLRHPNLGAAGCGSEDDESDFPYSNETIQDIGYAKQHIPFLLSPLPSLSASGFKDLMSYCPPSNLWISPHHYNKLFNSGFNPQGGAGDPAGDAISKRAEDLAKLQGVQTSYWVISGSFAKNGSTAQLDPAYQLSSKTPPDPASSFGQYCVQLSSATGPLATHCLNLSFEEPETGAPIDNAHFSIRVRDPGNVAKIALLNNNQQLAALNAGGAAPSVTIMSPQSGANLGGRQMVMWNASDGDGDPLTYTVLYSPDGGASWYPLDVDTGQNQCSLDTSQLQGGNNLMFRVLATDGLNTAEDTVGSITLAQQPQISADPLTLNLGGTVPGQGIEGALTLTNSGSGPLNIVSISSDNPFFEVISPSTPAIVQSGAPRELRVRFTPLGVGPQMTTITVASNAGAQPNLALTVQATGVEAGTPTLAISSQSLEFGTVGVGSSQLAAVATLNPSAADLTLTWSISGNGFTLSGGETMAILAAGEESGIEARFTPPTIGDFTGVLTITSNDPSRPQVEIALRGSGIQLNVPSGPQPLINAGGVVDAAGFQRMIAPGGIASLFGIELADSTVIAATVPLPTSLGGTQVLVNGTPAPLFFVSALQINFQTPFEAGTGEVTMVVVRNGVPSAIEPAQSKDFAPGIFANPSTLEPIVQRPDGALVNAQAPAQPGETLIFYVTGVGSLTDAPATGAPAGSNPLSVATIPATIQLGNAQIAPFYTGLAPLFIGLGQINATLPDPLPPAQNGTLPLTISFGPNASQTLNMPVAP